MVFTLIMGIMIVQLVEQCIAYKVIKEYNCMDYQCLGLVWKAIFKETILKKKILPKENSTTKTNILQCWLAKQE